jgi:hypothetical protein
MTSLEKAKASTVYLEDPHGHQQKHVKSVLSVPLDEAIAKAKPKVFTRKTMQLYYMMLVSMMV